MDEMCYIDGWKGQRWTAHILGREYEDQAHLPQLYVNPRILLQRLKQPSTTPLMTSMPIPPPQLFPLLLIPKLLFRIPIQERIFIIQHIEDHGLEQAETPGCGDEEVTGGGDGLVAD